MKRLLTPMLMGIVVVCFAFPFWWILVTSFKPEGEAFGASVLPFVQFRPTLQHWQQEMSFAGRELMRSLLNSVLVALGSSAIALVLGSLAGYALARFRLRLWVLTNKDLCGWFLSQVIIPPVVMVVPFFLLMDTLRLTDTRTALIIAHTTMTLPLAVLLLRDIFLSLPHELEEAALTDGCSWLGAWGRVALPLAMPGLISTGLICFAFSWNEFLYAITLSYTEVVTVPALIAGAKHVQGVEFGTLSVRALLAIVPPAVLALAVQRYVVRGLTFGALR